MKISDLLCYGAANAAPLDLLCSVTGLDGRTVRYMIAEERKAGAPILSDNVNGYFLPATDDERARFVQSMKHRASEILRAAEAVERGELC